MKAGNMTSPASPGFLIWIMIEGDKLYMMRCAGERIAETPWMPAGAKGSLAAVKVSKRH